MNQEAITSNRRRRSLSDLASEQLRAVTAGDVGSAHECEEAARPWELYAGELHVDTTGAVGVMLKQPYDTGTLLPPLAVSKAGSEQRFIPLDAPVALALCREDRLTADPVQRLIVTLDHRAAWDQLAAVFDWLAARRTEPREGLDDKRPAEIAALATGSFQHWKPYDAGRFRHDDAYARYLESVAQANAAWLAERQEAARQAPAGGEAADLAEDRALREALRAELRADEDLRGEIREELMAITDPEPGAFETMDQWLTVQIDRTERTARRQSTWSALEAGHRRSASLRMVRDILHQDQPDLGRPAAAPAPLPEPVADGAPLASPGELAPGGTEDTGRLVDAVRNIGDVLNDLDEIAADREQTALDILRMAGEDEPRDGRAAGLDDQLLTWSRLLVERWSD
ncbi:MAG: hypothetical protein OXG35_22770 [Acidobacteria bacterium]|nr:hypothetical protein [Acidobacteriota bacterium]